MVARTKVKVTPEGVPYVLEFAAVSVWPRVPVVSPTPTLLPELTPSPRSKPSKHSNDHHAPFTKPSGAKLARSHTIGSTHPRALDKALPPLPRPERSSSLRLFRRKTSQGIPDSERNKDKEKEGEAPAPDTSIRSRFKRRGTWQAIPTGPSAPHSSTRPSLKQIFGHSFSNLPGIRSEVDLSKSAENGNRSRSSSNATNKTHHHEDRERPRAQTPSAHPDGLFIRFSSSRSDSYNRGDHDDPEDANAEQGQGCAPWQAKTPPNILRRLRRTLAKAILAEGMDTPGNSGIAMMPDMVCGDVEKEKKGGGSEKDGSLFSGTYGQVKAAFVAAGLTVTQCPENGFGEATRLGAVFVARARDDGGVVFKKIVLWG